MRDPSFEVVEQTGHCVLLRDCGPWETHPTITNAAERVVEIVAPMLRGRRLEYIDSEGRRDQLLVKDGRFAGFAPAHVGCLAGPDAASGGP